MNVDAVLLALSLSNSFTKIGAIAAFAALVGIAIMATLLFAQARELKRLREWAEEEPGRLAEIEQRLTAATKLRIQRATAPLARAAPPPRSARALAESTGLATQVAPARVATPRVGKFPLLPAAPIVIAGRVPPAPAAPVPPPLPIPEGEPAVRVIEPAPGRAALAAAAREAAEASGEDAGQAHPEETYAQVAPAPHPDDARSYGAHPDDVHPDDARPYGAHPEDAHPHDVHPDDAHPQEARPIGTHPQAHPYDAPPGEQVLATVGAADTPGATEMPSAVETAAAAEMAAVSEAPSVRARTARPRSPLPPPGRISGRPAGRSTGAPSPRRPAAPASAGRAQAPRRPRRRGGPPPGPPFLREESSSRLRPLLLGGGALAVIVIAVLLLTSGGGSSKPSGSHHANTPAAEVAASPSEVSLVVLNDTEVGGLAHRVAANLRQSGYTQAAPHGGRPTTTRSSSIVEYAPGHRVDAEHVAQTLGVSAVAPLESSAAGLAGAASVIVIAGPDLASSASAASSGNTTSGSGTSSSGTPSSGATGEGSGPSESAAGGAG